MTKKDYELDIKITRLANRGVQKSIRAAKKAGIANPFMINGKLVFQLPDGTLTDKYKYPKLSHK